MPEGAVLIVDEAGQISGRQMLDLLRLVQEAKGRIILSGDPCGTGAVRTHFTAKSFLGVVLVCRAFQIARGSMPLPSPDSPDALFYFLGLIGSLVAGYMTGKGVARLFHRSQVRFFRSYQHQ